MNTADTSSQQATTTTAKFAEMATQVSYIYAACMDGGTSKGSGQIWNGDWNIIVQAADC